MKSVVLERVTPMAVQAVTQLVPKPTRGLTFWTEGWKNTPKNSHWRCGPS